MPAAALIRLEAAADLDAIRALTQRAFAGRWYSHGTEGALVDALRARGALALSLVAEYEGVVVGHIAFSPATADGQASRWFALGPVSVEPSLHKLGLGAQLIEHGLHLLRDRGAAGCVLIGDPAYYARFGFVLRPEMAPPGQPNEIFQVRHLGAPPREAPVIDFHPAFREVAP